MDSLQHSKSLSSSSDSILWTFVLDAGIVPSSIFCPFSEALTYFTTGPLNVCIFIETSFSGDLWTLIGVDINSRFISFCLLFGLCARYRRRQFSVVVYNPLPIIVSDLSSRNTCTGIRGFHKWAFLAFSSVICEMNSEECFLPGQYDVVRYISFFNSCSINWNLLRCYCNVHCFPVKRTSLVIFDYVEYFRFQFCTVT